MALVLDGRSDERHVRWLQILPEESVLSSAGDVCWGRQARALDAVPARDRRMAVVEQLMLRAALFIASLLPLLIKEIHKGR